MRHLMILNGVLALSLAVGCGDDGGSNGDPDAGEDPLVARGRYLVNDVSQCSFCHTPRREDGTPDISKFLAGTECFADLDPENSDAGCIAARNLTNHETGLMNVTDDEIRDSIQNGVGTDARNLLPIMPYWVFHNMTDEDVNAIIAYLRTVPGVDYQVPPSQPPFDEPPPAVLPPIDVDLIPMPRDDYPDQDAAMRGRYLSAMASLCVDCHTPEVTPGTFDFDFTKMMAGGRGFPKQDLGFFDPSFPDIIFTTNLTPHATGLEGYSEQDVIDVMKAGLNPDGEGVCAPTHIGPSSSYAGLTDDDVADIAAYVISLPPIDNAIAEECVAPPPP